MKKFFPFILILGVLAIAIGGGVVLYNAQQSTSASSGNIKSGEFNTGGANSASNGTATRVVSPGATPAHTRGDSTAPVILEEFGDFQCPVCARFYKDLKQVESEFGSKLCVIFREYPIQQLHPHALEAARAAEAAGLQNRFWEMHDLLYENQDTWVKENDTRPSFIGYAKSLGLNVQQFNNDLDGNIAAGRSLDDQKRAREMGVTGTPTIFINGKPPRDRNIDAIRNAINEALKEKGY